MARTVMEGSLFHSTAARGARHTVAHGIEESGMIARLRLAHPRWYLAAPSWTHLLRRVDPIRPARQGGASDMERAATHVARHRRMDMTRIDAERHWSGLAPR